MTKEELCFVCGERRAGDYGFCDSQSCVEEANEPNDYLEEL